MNSRLPSVLSCAVAWLTFFNPTRADVELQLVHDKTTNVTVVRACGLSESEWSGIAELEQDQLATVLRVFVKETREAEQPVIGTCKLGERCVLFQPRFPLQAGVLYVAEFRSRSQSAAVTLQELSLPELKRVRTAEVALLTPSAQILPQNLLKFYVHFTAPMSQGVAYDFIELSTVDGQVLEHPFLEISEELWDPSGRRLTLLLDPGRVKRGLVPREEDGPIFMAGYDYRLTIKADWPDAQGIPLTKGFVKEFRIAAEDFRQPDPANWVIQPARARTREPLTFVFPEPLDRATVASGISFRNARGHVIPGEFTFSAHETRAHFTPTKAWRAELVDVVISPIIEDLAGNSIERPFEVDKFDRVETSRPREKWITLEIRP